MTRTRVLGIAGVLVVVRARLRLVALIMVIALALALAAAAIVLRPHEADTLRTMPELGLVYPGSVALRDVAMVDPGSGTEALGLYGSDSSIGDIETWYGSELKSRGWLPGAGESTGTSTDEVAVCGWHTDRYRFRLGFWLSATLHRFDPGASDYASVYEIAIFAAETPLAGRECSNSPLRFWTPSPSP